MKVLFSILVVLLLGIGHAQAIDLYLLGKTDGSGTIKDTQIRDSRVTGISIRFSWRNANPSPGVYNWSFVTSQIQRARAAGKRAMIRPMAGPWRPQWVQGNVWEPTYMNAWVQFVSAMGATYRNDSTLFLAHISGPVDGSAEMHYSGVSPTPAIISAFDAAWKRSIDAYASAFPAKYSSLAMNNVFNSQDGTLLSISNYAKSRLGTMCSLQNNGFHGATPASFAPVQIIAGWNGMKGFQQRRKEGAAINNTITNANRFGARFLEIYPPDLQYVR